MPEQQVYLCDKTDEVEVGPKTPDCRKDVGDDPVSISFSYSVDGVPSVTQNKMFCSATHANFWVRRQHIGPADVISESASELHGD